MKNGACDAIRKTPIFIGVSSAAAPARASMAAATASSRAVTRIGHELRTGLPVNLVVLPKYAQTRAEGILATAQTFADEPAYARIRDKRRSDTVGSSATVARSERGNRNV